MRGFGGDPRLRAALRLARYVQESPEARSLLRHGVSDARRRMADRLGAAGFVTPVQGRPTARTAVGNVAVGVEREPLRDVGSVTLRNRTNDGLVDRLSPREARELARALLDVADEADGGR